MDIRMEQREFLRIIRACRRRMNIADFMKKSVFALCVGAGAGIVFQLAAFLTPLYNAKLYTLLALLLAELSVPVAMLARRTTMKQAALRMDSFGFEERIITAYECLDKEGVFVGLQREDALRQLQAHKDRIRIPVRPSLRKTGLLLLLLVGIATLSLLPSATKDRARELHSIREMAREKEEEIEEVMEDLEQLKQAELTKEQQDMLREMTESLESSLAEYQQADSQQMLTAASQKLNYKYENMSSQLSDIIQDLQDGAGVSVVSADELQKMADRVKDLSDMRQARGDGSGAGNGQGGQDGSGAGNGQGGQDGNGAGNGQGGQNGNGDGNGQGGQNGNGQGGGSGMGRGDGGSSTPHDYVSVPNAVTDSGNLTGTAGNHDTSEYFRAQTGLNWEGAHTSYEAAIGSYEQNAYEGIAAGRYPSGMEEIIKEYFSSFNQ